MSRRFLFLLSLLGSLLAAWTVRAVADLPASGDDSAPLGPLHDEFSLTLEPGHRSEWFGPLFHQQVAGEARSWALSPLISQVVDPGMERESWDVVYPALTYDRYGEEYRFQIFQLFSFAGGVREEPTNAHRFTLFPIYFQQRSEDPALNYTALLPLGGTIQNRFFGREEIKFALFPLWARTRKRDVVTENVLFPFFHSRHGDGLEGFQFWPLLGWEEKVVTTRTNRFGDPEEIPGHEKIFLLWPLISEQRKDIGTTNPVHQFAFFPFLWTERSPKRDYTTVPAPFGFSYADDRGERYRQWGFPSPVFVIARGEGRQLTRFWPFYAHGAKEGLETRTLMWPLYTWRRQDADLISRERTRIAYFLYSDIIERRKDEHTYAQRQAFWPFYVYQRDHQGNQRFQTLALFEPMLALNPNIERNYSPLWSIYRSETNAVTHAASQSLLWNTYRHDHATNGARKSSLLFGLVQWETGTDGGHTQRWFYLPKRKVY